MADSAQAVALAAHSPYENMSPTMLAAQPALPVETRKRFKPDWDWDQIFNHLESRLGFLRNWRYSWWVHWALLAQFFSPRRYIWLVTANRMWRGAPINDAIIDGTGSLALQICASGMWSGLTNPTRPWFKLGLALPWLELPADAKDWFEDTEERVRVVMSESNFYTEFAQAFYDLSLIGTAPLIIYEDYADVVRLYLPTAGEYYLANGARLEADTLYREFTYTVAQVVEFATIDNCPEEIVKLWNVGGASLDIEYVVAHAIEPNFKLTRRGASKGDVEIAVVPGVFTYREIYWLKGIKTLKPLSKRGFHTKPFIAMRWAKAHNEPYGRGPCMDALGDCKQDQMETREKGEFIKKLTKPPMGADVTLRNEPASIIPGHITYMPGNAGPGQKGGFWPLFEVQPAALTPLIEDIKEIQGRLRQYLFVDVFMAITQMEGVQPRNELELTKRDLERLAMLGPVIHLVEGQLALAVQRILDIMLRRKLLKPMPQSLRGMQLKISFINIARLAQRSAESVAMKDTFATMGELSSAAKAAGLPDPLRVFNLDKSGRRYADSNNFPSDCVFTPEEVLGHDKAREKATQQAQTPQNAMAAVTAAKTLAETPMGGNTALSALTGGGGAPAPAGP